VERFICFSDRAKQGFGAEPPWTDSQRPGKQMTLRPHKEGISFSIALKVVPLDGRLVALPPDGNDDRM
jgi:hypothetical protein